MEEELKLNDIADDLLIVNKTTIERLFQEKDKEILVLYMFYYKTAKWQNHNPIKATDEYTKKCLHWGTDKLKKLKSRLKEMELIEIEKRLNDKKRVEGWYVRLKYYNSTTPDSTTPISPHLVSQETNTIYNNILNTNNNKNTKEINKERKEDIEEIVEYLNITLDTNYRPSSQFTKHINARLDEGYTKEDFYTVIENKYEEWHGTEMEKYLRPDTLFGTKFDIYLNQK